ncbi:hypothetical protein BDW60DRAFT_226869 [Aspergillus nidulans var. acristatus]
MLNDDSVLFKFRSGVTLEQMTTFIRELKTLKNLPSVKNGRLIVGSPSVTDPIERSKGFQIALVSYHENLAALAEYQASEDHHRITSTYFIPYKEDLVRFDFEVDVEDEYMWLPIRLGSSANLADLLRQTFFPSTSTSTGSFTYGRNCLR